jgi:hypothetical protein
MAFEVSEKTQAILDMINEFVDRELVPIERDLFEKDPLIPGRQTPLQALR